MRHLDTVAGMKQTRRLKVFLTIDTEVGIHLFHSTGADRALDHDIYGSTAEGEYGLRYQLYTLDQYALKAVFFVEALFGSVVGLRPLGEIVRLIEDRGQEVGLHVHTEWLRLMNTPYRSNNGAGQNIKDFTVDEQTRIIAQGLKNLSACGASRVRSFRAGNTGANFDTLRALARNGIQYDSSYYVPYLGSHCGLDTPTRLCQPALVNGVWEFPIAWFVDRPGHSRPAQLCACSSYELEHALLQAWQQGWRHFVILTHSFELIKRPSNGRRTARPDKLVIARFHRLCRFLAAHPDKFETATFEGVDADELTAAPTAKPITSNLGRTVWRYAEQLSSRLM